MAPEGFLPLILGLNPYLVALALSLLPLSGGHEVLMQPYLNTTIKLLDITMLAEDIDIVANGWPPLCTV